MALIRFEKYVASLPAVLTANTLYFVKNWAWFDLYLTNDTWTVVAFPLNSSWSSGWVSESDAIAYSVSL